jgi:hypothetical protein
MTATTPPVRVRITRHPADAPADVTVGRTYQADVDPGGVAVVTAGGAGAGARLQPGEYEFARWWLRNSRDPGFQGDGWRWSLSLWLPGIRLPRWWRLRRPTIVEEHAASQAHRELGHWPPWTLDLLPLTGEQVAAVWAEWLAVQREQAALACSAGAHVWTDPRAAAQPVRQRAPGDQDECANCPTVRVVVDPDDGRGRHYVFAQQPQP